MSLNTPTPKQLENIYSELNMTPDGIERDTKYLKEWMKQQPHLPEEVDERRLSNLLFFCKNSVEKVKRVIDLYYTVRGQVPEFFKNRDPLNTEMQKTIDTVLFCPLPNLTTEGDRISLFRLMDPDPSLYDLCVSLKMAFMVGDLRILEDRCLSDILVYDLRCFSLAHVLRITLPVLKKFMYIGQKAFPIRQKAVHLIYAPVFVDKILMFFKPLMKEKLAKRLYVHSGGFGSLFDHIPRSLFPEDYGGDEPPMKEIHKQWKKKLIENREFFLKEEKIFTDESKRPGKPKNVNDLFGLEGSFRSLSVD